MGDDDYGWTRSFGQRFDGFVQRARLGSAADLRPASGVCGGGLEVKENEEEKE